MHNKSSTAIQRNVVRLHLTHHLSTVSPLESRCLSKTNKKKFRWILCNINILEKEARVAWQPLVNLLGTHTYKYKSFRSSTPAWEHLWSKCNTLEAYPSKSLEPHFRNLCGPVGSNPKFSSRQ